MISSVSIQAFKSITRLDVQCAAFNLIVGRNSAGKSTFLQALLVAAQNTSGEYGLNGPAVALGDFREVQNYNMRDTPIRISYCEQGKKEWWVEIKESDHTDGTDCEVFCSDDDFDPIREELYWPPVDDERTMPLNWELGFHYLSCHRIGAQDLYRRSFGASAFDETGEYVIGKLENRADSVIEKELLSGAGQVGDRLADQVNYWLNYILDGTTMRVQRIINTDYVQLRYNSNPHLANQESLFCRPSNVGAGTSYLITMLSLCLMSEKGDVILIENPEVHLHPKAQSRLCKFLYFISRNNRQLFVETHSDHLFNWIRAGIAEQTIEASTVAVNFFVWKDGETKCNPIEFGEFGRIRGKNPDLDLNDLFDQFDLDMDRMVGL